MKLQTENNGEWEGGVPGYPRYVKKGKNSCREKMIIIERYRERKKEVDRGRDVER